MGEKGLDAKMGLAIRYKADGHAKCGTLYSASQSDNLILRVTFFYAGKVDNKLHSKASVCGSFEQKIRFFPAKNLKELVPSKYKTRSDNRRYFPCLGPKK